MKRVICQFWEESERGWGCRPDGVSLHLDKETLVKYIGEYWASMPQNTPSEYSRPEGEPFELEVSEDLYFEIKGRGGSKSLGQEFRNNIKLVKQRYYL